MDLDAIELDYKTSIQAIFRAFKDKITLFGTIDPSGIITYGTPEEVQTKAKEILDIYKDNPRLVIGAGCAIPPLAPEANIRAIVTAAKEAKLY